MRAGREAGPIPEGEAWDMLERVNLFLIQFRSDLAKGAPIEHELFPGTIRNWHRLSREVEEMFRDGACSRRNDRGCARATMAERMRPASTPRMAGSASCGLKYFFSAAVQAAGNGA
jgi:hypothetical protein